MSLAAEVWGRDGPDCVLVHGWGLNRAVWNGLRDDLSVHCRVHAVDLPGHGASTTGAPGLDAWAGRLAATTSRPAVWIAWSLGGLIGLRVAQWRPDRVRALVLVDTSPRFAAAEDWPWGASESLLDGFANRLETDFDGLLREFIALNARGVEEDSGETLRRLRSAVALAPPTVDGLRQGLDILRGSDLRTVLPQVWVPTLVVNGERDRLTHPEVARWVARALPDAEYWSVKGAAHAPFLSHARAFQAKVIDFLKTRCVI